MYKFSVKMEPVNAKDTSNFSAKKKNYQKNLRLLEFR